MENKETVTPIEQIVLWADRLRDISASGLQYAPTIYDRERYEALQTMAMEMIALATTRSLEMLEPLRTTFFSRPSPVVAGTAAIIDEAGHILLMRRSDNNLWQMPGGGMEVGETPAAAVVREAYEETGVSCEPIALVGVYDSRLWDMGRSQHIYKFTFLCKPLSRDQWSEAPSHTLETSETGWFAEDALPDDLYEGHSQRIRDAFRIWRGDLWAHFDL